VTGRADAASRASGAYDHYRRVLVTSAGITPVDLDAFEDFLDREVSGRIGQGDRLTWSQYRAFFRYWGQLGEAQAAGIAAEVRERVRTGSVQSPQAYLMWALKHRATATQRTGASSPRPTPLNSTNPSGSPARSERAR